MNKVKMKVSNGSIYLFGELDSEIDYEKVVTLVESTEGVTAVNVDNLTIIGRHDSLKDLQLTAKIKGTLIREKILDRNFPAWTIDVKTKNDQVYLTGEVASAEHKKIILDSISSISEVSNIIDKIKLSPRVK
ncbi:BON domain-containing protein [Legionella clemsonensis]|uniref:Periplasmic protein n=1 Tax=Legionella clemsonensis TaxID=1867846 RepID=A0A222NZP3_9GAMM|nr:BON domain-containing protein [Legionella clemsonensis]ASQ45062.1 periplasmic protein [Legionella clemsonensis]